MLRCWRVFAWLSAFALGSVAAAQGVYEKDVAFALDALQQQCGGFFELKKIDWKKVEKEFTAEAKLVKTDQDHLVLLTRLLARLKDGHCEVLPSDKTKDVAWPEDGPHGMPREAGNPGMTWCRVGKKLYVKSVWGAAAQVGVEPGMELVTVDGVPSMKWLDASIVKLRDWRSCSTDAQALFIACGAGLMGKPGARMELELKELSGKPKKRTVTFATSRPTFRGPAVMPPNTESTDDLNFALLASGFGYVQLRRSKESLPEQMDTALAKVGDAPGLVLDFRGNSGGGCDHDAFMGRFVPHGKSLDFADHYASAGPRPYAGPIVVIVDATCVSTGETTSGIFKEDGRGYMIGESTTAGMSSQKRELALPSGLFSLYVSVASNKGRFNAGKGIEGIGVVPHEIVEFSPKDLAAGVDTLIARAEALLAKFPQDKVPYKAPR